MSSSTYTLAVPSSTRCLAEVRRFVVNHASRANWPDDAIEALKLAVDEACTNVIQHAYQGEPGHEVCISVTAGPRSITIRICDEGRPFDLAAYTEPDVARYVAERKGGGLGVHIIRRLMDQVKYRTSDGKNEICLVKYRP